MSCDAINEFTMLQFLWIMDVYFTFQCKVPLIVLYFHLLGNVIIIQSNVNFYSA